MIQSDWFGCYTDNWKNEITPDAFSHPAKYSRALIRRIYQHVLEEGWIAAGDTVLDPFGGVGLGGLDSMRAGLHWVGVELEPRFVELGNQNIELWRALAERAAAWGLNGWGTATLLRGDSRRLASVLAGRPEAAGDAGAGLGVSSPPYVSGGHHDGTFTTWGGDANKQGGCAKWATKDGGYGSDPANLGNMREGSHAAAVISSPPYAGSVNQSDQANDSVARLDRKEQAGIDITHKPNVGGPNSVLNKPQVYGHTPGQLGAMAVSSPPYAESLASDDPDKRGGLFRDPKRRNDKTLTAEYGTSPGQLGAMAVSSPPYSSTLGKGNETKGFHSYDEDEAYNRCKRDYIEPSHPANMGNDTGTDFWQAARAVVEQLRLCLRPGAHAVWVLKGFVRDKTYVDFPMQWAEMCQACRFEPVHWHRAWLVEEHTGQLTLDGGMHIKRVERKSFFRRLAESKGSPRVDYEIVLCTRLIS